MGQEQSSRTLRCGERPRTELHHPLTLNSKGSDPLAGSEGEAVWVCSVTGSACDSGSITIGSGATSTAVAVTETTKVTGSDDATDDGIVLVVPVIGAAMVGTIT